MRPDKIYAPDAPNIHDTRLYVMKKQNGTRAHKILTCKNGRRVRDAWQSFVNNLKEGETAILYEGICKFDLLTLNKALMKQMCYNDFCSTPDKLLETINNWSDGDYNTARCVDDDSWSIPINTFDENKMIEIQTEIIKYIKCNDFNIHQTPNGYQIVFNNDTCQYEIMQILREHYYLPNLELMLPIAWQTKQ